jgi:tyrosine-protein phosphatase SIW14
LHWFVDIANIILPMNKLERILLILFLIILSFSSFSQNKQEERLSKWAKPISNHEFKNLYKLNDSIFRSEQPTAYGFSELCDLGIKSVLNLRLDQADHNPEKDCKFNCIQVKMDPDKFTYEDVIKALKAIQKAPKPLLVHCFYGADRTGMILALYRVIYQKWNKADAIKEMVEGGYGFHKSYKNMIDFINNANIDKMRKDLK